MDINKKGRDYLKERFVKNAIPTQQDFADLIDAALNQKDDGIVKPANEPLSIEAPATDNRPAIRFYEAFADVKPAWELSLLAGDPAEGKKGFTLSDGDKNTRLFIDGATGIMEANGLTVSGNVSVGATDSAGHKLRVTGSMLIEGGLDIAEKQRTGTHPSAPKGLYITGDFGPDSNGVEIRHTSGLNGIGIGYNTIYATGENANQSLRLKPRGTGTVIIAGNLVASSNIIAKEQISTETLIAVKSIQANGGLKDPASESLSVVGSASITGDITMGKSVLRIGTPAGTKASPGEVVGALGFVGYGQSHGQLSYRASQGQDRGFELVDCSSSGPSLSDPQDPIIYSNLKLHTMNASGNVAIAGTLSAMSNVGIGTATPQKKLHVEGASSGPFLNDANDRPGIAITGHYPELGLFSNIGNSHHGPTIRLGAYTDATASAFKHWVIGTAGLNAAFLDIGFSDKNDPSPHAGIRNYNGKTMLTILETGKVGIGTTAPAAKLEVAGQVSIRSPDAEIYSLQLVRTDEEKREHRWAFWHMNEEYRKNALEIWEYKTDSQGKSCGGDLTDGAMCVARFVILEGGNVGIGTATPATKLDVAGSTYIGGTLYVDGDIESKDNRMTLRTRTHEGTNFQYAVLHVKGLLLSSHVRAKSKQFQIDHPLDRAHKHLVHASLEGPEVGVYYRGEGQLTSGRAVILLPSYFEALTRKEDRTVIVTPRCEEDEPVSALAATAITGGRFMVRAIDAQNPSQRFYWEVKAVRADLPALEVEPVKTAASMAMESTDAPGWMGELS